MSRKNKKGSTADDRTPPLAASEWLSACAIRPEFAAPDQGGNLYQRIAPPALHQRYLVELAVALALRSLDDGSGYIPRQALVEAYAPEVFITASAFPGFWQALEGDGYRLKRCPVEVAPEDLAFLRRWFSREAMAQAPGRAQGPQRMVEAFAVLLMLAAQLGPSRKGSVGDVVRAGSLGSESKGHIPIALWSNISPLLRYNGWINTNGVDVEVLKTPLDLAPPTLEEQAAA